MKHTKGQPAGNLIIELYKALHEIAIELSANDGDREFVEAHLNRFIDIISEMGTNEEYRCWLRMGADPGKVFEAELILRLMDRVD